MQEFAKVANDEDDTSRFAADIALSLSTGDLVLVSGPLGAGKTHLARTIIRTLTGDAQTDIPSPTYTLCNQYEGPVPVLHCDFYRLQHEDEVEELGWQDALESSCVIIEWPERVFGVQPDNSLWINLEPIADDVRKITIVCTNGIQERVQRSLEIRSFLDQSGYANANRSPFAADASARNYERIKNHGAEFLLMDAPESPDGPVIRDGKTYSELVHLAESVHGFVAIDQVLRNQGFLAPRVYAKDMANGLLLLENLGNGAIVDHDGNPIEERYQAAIEMLVELHHRQIPSEVRIEDCQPYSIPFYDQNAVLTEAELLLEWYVPYKQGHKASKKDRQMAEFREIWSKLWDKLDHCEKSLVLRDFHSPNIIWQDRKQGIDRVGLIDFQDALIGPITYDVASIAQDARVDVSEALENRLVDHYIKLRKNQDQSFDQDSFLEYYAITAAQRATKILGIFVRLDQRDSKPEYLAHLPRVEHYLKRSLRHDGLAEYRAWIDAVINL